ncbi:MAG: hypothetical protein ACLPYY_08280 [Acidimicrobiales bacterium]
MLSSRAARRTSRPDDRLRVILDPDDPTKSIAIVPDPPAEPSG